MLLLFAVLPSMSLLFACLLAAACVAAVTDVDTVDITGVPDSLLAEYMDGVRTYHGIPVVMTLLGSVTVSNECKAHPIFDHA